MIYFSIADSTSKQLEDAAVMIPAIVHRVTVWWHDRATQCQIFPSAREDNGFLHWHFVIKGVDEEGKERHIITMGAVQRGVGAGIEFHS